MQTDPIIVFPIITRAIKESGMKKRRPRWQLLEWSMFIAILVYLGIIMFTYAPPLSRTLY